MPKRSRKLQPAEEVIYDKFFIDNSNVLNIVFNEFFDSFKLKFREQLDYDVKHIKECTIRAILNNYLLVLLNIINNNKTSISSIEDVDLIVDEVKTKARNKLADEFAPDISFEDTIDRYFNDVKRTYIKHPMGESEKYEMSEATRDLYIYNNLKTVIECAKRYRGLGLDFKDLIQAGNVGLMKAWECFDINKANLQNAIIKNINNSSLESFTYDEASSIIEENFKYPKLLEQTLKKIPQSGFESKEEFVNWTKKYIKKASFASLGFIWARAAIISELNALSNIVKVPKSVRTGDDKVLFINLDSLNPHTGDNYTDNETFEVSEAEFIEDDNNIENTERIEMFKSIVSNILHYLDPKDRRIIMKRFGIDLPYQLSVADIAANESMSQHEVKQRIENALSILAKNIKESDRDILIEML